MKVEPANLLEYQPRSRYEQSTSRWRQTIFYILSIVGLIVVLGAIFLTLLSIGAQHGLW